MSNEEFIKVESDKRIEEFKNKYKERGMVFDELQETMMRIGIAHGITIAGLALVNTDLTKLVSEDK